MLEKNVYEIRRMFRFCDESYNYILIKADLNSHLKGGYKTVFGPSEEDLASTEEGLRWLRR